MHQVENLMFTGQVPWHGLGVPLQEAPTWTDAIKAASLDWRVSLRKLYVRKPTDADVPEFQLIPDHFSVVRDTDQNILGVVGRKFKPIQNEDSFKFLDAMAGMLRYETAGSLQGGRTVFMLARLDNDIILDKHGDDVVQTYLLLANSHDGTRALTVRLTTVRVVCMNTLAMALGQGGKKFRILHTTEAANNISSKAQDAAEFLGLVHGHVGTLGNYMQALTQVKVNDTMFNKFMDDMFPMPEPDKDPTGRRATYVNNNRAAMKQFYFDGPGQDLPTSRGTAWGLLNAATGYATHRKSVRVQGGTSIKEDLGEAAYEHAKRETRFRSLTMGGAGSAAGFNLRAMESLASLVPEMAQA